MRATPIAVYSHLLEPKNLREVIKQDVQLTHSHVNVHDAILLYCYAIGQLIKYADEDERATKTFDKINELCKQLKN